SLTAGSDAIAATYADDANFTVSTPATLTQTVNAQSATLSLASSLPTSSNVNQSVTFTASITAGAVSPLVPSGTVSFTAKGSPISGCTSVAVNGSGNWTCTTSSLVAGSDAIAATYAG